MHIDPYSTFNYLSSSSSADMLAAMVSKIGIQIDRAMILHLQEIDSITFFVKVHDVSLTLYQVSRNA